MLINDVQGTRLSRLWSVAESRELAFRSRAVSVCRSGLKTFMRPGLSPELYCKYLILGGYGSGGLRQSVRRFTDSGRGYLPLF